MVCGLAEETVRIELTIINVKIVDLKLQKSKHKKLEPTKNIFFNKILNLVLRG